MLKRQSNQKKCKVVMNFLMTMKHKSLPYLLFFSLFSHSRKRNSLSVPSINVWNFCFREQQMLNRHTDRRTKKYIEVASRQKFILYPDQDEEGGGQIQHYEVIIAQFSLIICISVEYNLACPLKNKLFLDIDSPCSSSKSKHCGCCFIHCICKL